MLYKDLTILNGDQDHPDAFLVALETATGRERWRAPRPGIRSYCPPSSSSGRAHAACPDGAQTVASYDPETGKQFWVIDGPTEQFVASFVYADGLLFMTSGTRSTTCSPFGRTVRQRHELARRLAAHAGRRLRAIARGVGEALL